MSDMIMKSVDVLGDTIMATKDEKGNIWAGVSYFCNALGMSKGQKDRQIANMQKDEILKRGCFKFEAGVFDPANEAIGIRIDFIPLWLAKISITKAMLQEYPELVSKLLNYQLKAKDILAAAFLPNGGKTPKTIPEQIQTIAQGTAELYERVEKVDNKVDDIKAEVETLKDDMPLFLNEAEEISNAVKKKGVEILGGKRSKAYRDGSLRQKLYSDIYTNLKHNFNVSTYKAIKRGNRKEALRIVLEYQPPFFLHAQIDTANSQINLDFKRLQRR